MSVHTKDGAWLSIQQLVRLDCDKCGVVYTSKFNKNDRECDDLIREHAKKHGGIRR
jgi:hypothetical protein